MVPSSYDIMDKRHRNRRRLRSLALTLLLMALMSMLWTGSEMWFYGNVSFSILLFQMRLAFVFFIPAVLLMVFERRIARWLVPTPQSQCANCDYPLERLTTPVCPECGYEVPARFVTAPEAAESGVADA